MLSKLIKKLRKPEPKPVFRTISDLDLITHSKTQVPMLLVIGTGIKIYMN